MVNLISHELRNKLYLDTRSKFESVENRFITFYNTAFSVRNEIEFNLKNYTWT